MPLKKFPSTLILLILTHSQSINKRRYQFTINPQFIIDAGFFGNYTRFINSAQGNNVNCVAHREFRLILLGL